MQKKSISFLSSILFSLLISSAATAAPLPVLDVFHGWEKLGEKKVNFKADRDEIRVTAHDGLFTALKLTVKDAGINLHRAVVHFANGQTQTVNVKQNIARGQSSRVLNLNGNRRIIQKVVLYYDTKNRARQRATVELWGRH